MTETRVSKILGPLTMFCIHIPLAATSEHQVHEPARASLNRPSIAVSQAQPLSTHQGSKHTTLHCSRRRTRATTAAVFTPVLLSLVRADAAAATVLTPAPPWIVLAKVRALAALHRCRRIGHLVCCLSCCARQAQVSSHPSVCVLARDF